jgi:tRNA(His) guanylyltransferase
MSNIKLRDRIEQYHSITDYKLMARLPIIICVNGKNFSKNTQLLDKPYSAEFSEAMCSTMLKLCSEVDGTIFSYQFNDEIVLVLRNDQSSNTNMWCGGNIQKICSIVSSMATLHFNLYSSSLNMTSSPLFISQTFAVPTIAEAVNVIIYKQQHNFYLSIQFACLYELIKKYDKNNIKDMISGLSIDEQIDLLQQESGVDFNKYPLHFRRGAGCFRIPKIMDNGEVKNKWGVNLELPIFTKDQSFLTNLFRMGSDIFRQESL